MFAKNHVKVPHGDQIEHDRNCRKDQIGQRSIVHNVMLGDAE